MSTPQKTYADVLFSLAGEKNIEEKILSDLNLAAEAVNRFPEYTALLSAPGIERSERLRLIDLAFGSRVDILLVHFIKLLTENGNPGLLPACRDEYRMNYNEKFGVLEVTVITAVRLDDKQKDQIIKKVERLTGKKAVLTEQVDPSCIGGLKIVYPGKLIDASLQKVFSGLSEKLKKLDIPTG